MNHDFFLDILYYITIYFNIIIYTYIYIYNVFIELNMQQKLRKMPQHGYTKSTN